MLSLSDLAHMPATPVQPPSQGRGAYQGMLVVLLLVMLLLLAWQLHQQYRQAQEAAQQRSLDSAEQLLSQVSLTLELKAQVASALLSRQAAQPLQGALRDELLFSLQQLFPNLHSLAWVGPQGLVDSAEPALPVEVWQTIRQRQGEQPYYLSWLEAPQLLQMSLRQAERPGHYWLLRMHAQALPLWLPASQSEQAQWLLFDQVSQQVLWHSRGGRVQPAPLSAEQAARSLRRLPLPHSDGEIIALSPAPGLLQGWRQSLAMQLLFFVLCLLLALLVLYALLREQRRLRELHAGSQRSLLQAASALAAIDEQVLVSDCQGQLRFLNRRAEQMFGLSSAQAGQYRLAELLPGVQLDADASSEDELLPLLQNGTTRLFAVHRSELQDAGERLGLVWVLRDVTEQQQALAVLDDTRRRYQDIFQGAGCGLCVLDLSALRQRLQQLQVRDQAQLLDWLAEDGQRHAELLQLLRISEINQLGKQLLGVADARQAWRLLIDHGPLEAGSARLQLLVALLGRPQHLAMESCIRTAQGETRYLWLTLNLPDNVADLDAVTLSMSDISSRKSSELALVEREHFWGEVIRAVPDLLYVHDIPGRRVLFSNNHLMTQLGYDTAQWRALGNNPWEKLLHPDDGELYGRLRNLQKVIGNGQLMQFELRWRHRNGHWHWFDIREQALSRDHNGRVSRLIGIAKDITEQIAAREALRANEQRYRLLAESTSDVIVTTDRDLRLNYVSPSAEKLFGYDGDWLLAHGFDSLIAVPAQLQPLLALLAQVRQLQGQPARLQAWRARFNTEVFVLDCLRADGKKIPVELRVSLLWDEQQRLLGLLGVGRDISQQRRAEKQLRMAATVFEHSTAAIMVTDLAGYIVQVNETFGRISGFASGEVIDQQPAMLMADRQQVASLQFIRQRLAEQGSWEGELWLRRKQGEPFPAWVGITAIRDDDGDLVSYVCFFNDISERKASEQRIHRLAYYDNLTQLPNRTLFQDRLHTALQHAARHEQWVALMFLDLDRFKPINDSLGHAAGDRMLKEVAQRLQTCVAEEDTVARMGGDEFTLLLVAQESRDQALHRAIRVAERILEGLQQAFVLEGREFFISASVGIALAPQDGTELSQLMKNADTAMYHAKEKGKNNFQFYQAEMNARALERLELESDLRHALEAGQFCLYYQPQFSGDGKRLIGAEALLRWAHPRRGLVRPDEFVPALEELGLVVQVGDWVLQEACRQLQAWQMAGLQLPKVSINLSARQFADGQLGARIAATLAQVGLAPAALELELTESILMRDVAETLQVLRGLKRLGVGVAVDDFGTGYSSLNYLKQFPIDVLKIDRSFVDGVPDGEQDAQIARAIIAMAHSLNLRVIAEGVEEQAQLDFLREHGCDQVQGYLFGRPMPAASFAARFSGAALFILE